MSARPVSAIVRSKIEIESPSVSRKGESRTDAGEPGRANDAVLRSTGLATSAPRVVCFHVKDDEGVRRVKVPFAFAQQFLEKNFARIVGFPAYLRAPGARNG
jgi:hypothetical protein